MNKNALLIAIIAVVAIIIVAAVLVLPPAEEEDQTATINGTEYTYEQMMDEFGTETVGDHEGVPLGAIITDTNLTSPEDHAYVLTADDGYAMAVTWDNLETGILAQITEEDDDTAEEVTYLMTVFPDLPGAYSVKYLETITPDNTILPIFCNGLDYFLDYMPKRVNEKTVSYTHNDEAFNYTGHSLSDMVNYTGLESPETHEYMIVGYEAGAEEPWYNQTVSWDGMMGGIIVDEDTKVVFDDSTEYATDKYRVKYVIEILVE